MERLNPTQLQRLENALTTEAKAKIADLLPESLGVQSETITLVGPPSDLLGAIVESRDVDPVVMGAGHGKSGVRWLGSNCHKMVRSAPCPVLIV